MAEESYNFRAYTTKMAPLINNINIEENGTINTKKAENGKGAFSNSHKRHPK